MGRRRLPPTKAATPRPQRSGLRVRLFRWEDLAYTRRRNEVTTFAVESELKSFLQNLFIRTATLLLCRREATITN